MKLKGLTLLTCMCMGIPEGGVRYRPGGSRKGKVMGWSLIENYIGGPD